MKNKVQILVIYNSIELCREKLQTGDSGRNSEESGVEVPDPRHFKF